MGLFDKLFGGSPRGAQGQFDRERVLGAVQPLIAALDALANTMKAEESNRCNPGWEGRLRDLRSSSAALELLKRNPSFEKDDLFEVLTTVRPLFRGAPPAGFEHLADLNAAVVAGIEGVHAAS